MGVAQPEQVNPRFHHYHMFSNKNKTKQKKIGKALTEPQLDLNSSHLFIRWLFSHYVYIFIQIIHNSLGCRRGSCRKVGVYMRNLYKVGWSFS